MFSVTNFIYFLQVIIDAVDTQTQSSFVVHWISRYIPDIDKWRAFIPDTQHSPNQAAVNELLNQFFSNSAFPARYLHQNAFLSSLQGLLRANELT